MPGFHFLVTGAASPDFPLRVFNLFAQRDLAFDRVAIDRADDCYTVSIEHPGLASGPASIIAEKIGALVLVESVEMRALSDRTDQ